MYIFQLEMMSYALTDLLITYISVICMSYLSYRIIIVVMCCIWKPYDIQTFRKVRL